MRNKLGWFKLFEMFEGFLFIKIEAFFTLSFLLYPLSFLIYKL